MKKAFLFLLSHFLCALGAPRANPPFPIDFSKPPGVAGLDGFNFTVPEWTLDKDNSGATWWKGQRYPGPRYRSVCWDIYQKPVEPHWIFKEAIPYLKGLKEMCRLPAYHYGCERVSCSYRTAVRLCSAWNAKPVEVPCADLARMVQDIVFTCTFLGWVVGKAYSDDNMFWVEVLEDRYKC